jgi:hypothetical protein
MAETATKLPVKTEAPSTLRDLPNGGDAARKEYVDLVEAGICRSGQGS